MSNLAKESTIMSSNDGSITLTTHRLLQRTRAINKEMMLSDFISYEQVGKRNKYYRNLVIFFLLSTVVLGFWYYSKVRDAESLGYRLRDAFSSGMSINEEVQLSGGFFAFSGFLLALSILVYLLSRKQYLRVSGKFSSIDFSITHLSNESYSKFTNALITESDNRKRD